MKQAVEIFSDGACRGNPGAGGWGVLIRYGKLEKKLCGGFIDQNYLSTYVTSKLPLISSRHSTCASNSNIGGLSICDYGKNGRN